MIKVRLTKLRAQLKKKKLDALLVSLPANRRYLSGFLPNDNQWGESAGSLLITPTEAIIFTDFRYELTARTQALFYTPYIHREGLAIELAKILKGSRIKRLGFEAEALLVIQRDNLANVLTNIEFVATHGIVQNLRQYKDPYEINAIQASLAITEKILSKTLTNNLVNYSELELARAINRELPETEAFPPIVASGPNAAEPHAEPSERILSLGEPVIFDIGAKLKGYCSDISRTIIVGGVDKASPQFREIYSIVYQAQYKAIAEIRPGMNGMEADSIARKIIEQSGFGKYFSHSLGHGVGLAIHERPSLAPNSLDILQPNMIFTIEPGIYLPGWGGIRLEQMVLLTINRCELLNKLNNFYYF